MARSVADAESVRRQNRALVLMALRRHGPLSRTQLVQATGLSAASLTAIGGDLIAEGLLVELPDLSTATKARGRPATQVTFNRRAAHCVLVEIDVNNARFSLCDYAGTLVDRVDTPMAPHAFSRPPADLLVDHIERILARNPEGAPTLRTVTISLQGMLDKSGDRLRWSPIAGFAGQSIALPLSGRFGVPVRLVKRGPLLAEGTRALYPELREATVASIFIGSTVALGLASHGHQIGRGDEGATEFGHMNHVPAGARCRCGMRGCVEAYAADYGVLRTAYGVPEETPPASSVPAAEYQELVRLARAGRRNEVHAFRQAGRAIGFGLSRLMSIVDLTHVVISGPGAAAFELMQPEIEAALRQSLVCSVNGLPTIMAHHDEREPIFQGMLIRALAELDEAQAAASGPRPRPDADPDGEEPAPEAVVSRA